MDKFLNTIQIVLFSLMLIASLTYAFVIDYIGFKIGAILVALLVARGVKYLVDERKSSKEISK